MAMVKVTYTVMVLDRLWLSFPYCQIQNFQWLTSHLQRVGTELLEIYNKQLCLVFDGVEVPCHKIVLAAASPVLEAMVENKMREAIESKADIKLTEEVGKGFLQFLYTGDLQDDLLKQHTPAFLSLAEMYDLPELKDMAETELLIQLDKENMVAMISIGEIFRADEILEAALKMTKANMPWLRSQVSTDNLSETD